MFLHGRFPQTPLPPPDPYMPSFAVYAPQQPDGDMEKPYQPAIITPENLDTFVPVSPQPLDAFVPIPSAPPPPRSLKQHIATSIAAVCFFAICATVMGATIGSLVGGDNTHDHLTTKEGAVQGILWGNVAIFSLLAIVGLGALYSCWSLNRRATVTPLTVQRNNVTELQQMNGPHRHQPA